MGHGRVPSGPESQSQGLMRDRGVLGMACQCEGMGRFRYDFR